MSIVIKTQTQKNKNMKTSNTVSAVPALTLKEAVIEEVTKLVKTAGSFSAHDVTAAVRTAANDGEVALPGLEAKPNSSNIKYWVNHDDVKAVVDGLLNDGTLANLGLTNVDYTSNPYRVFQFGSASAPAPSAPVSANTSDDVDDADAAQSPLAQRMLAYVRKVGVATLKEVQSALKVNGITCKDFAGIAQKLGLKVKIGTLDCYSTYTVSQ